MATFNMFTFGFVEAMMRDAFGPGSKGTLTPQATRLVCDRCDEFQRSSAWKAFLKDGLDKGHSKDALDQPAGAAFWLTSRKPENGYGFNDGGWDGYDFPYELTQASTRRPPLVAFRTPSGQVAVIEYEDDVHG